MPPEIALYHNPRCSKSREALALLEEKGLQPEVIRYLETPPSVEELRTLLEQLDLAPRDLMRKKEALYKSLNLAAPDLDDEALIQAMHENPILIERPIACSGGKAALGRPPENVLSVLNQ